MACNSLFSYEPAGENQVTSDHSFQLSGGFTIPGYSTPGWTTTTHLPNIHWHTRPVCVGAWEVNCKTCYSTTGFTTSICSAKYNTQWPYPCCTTSWDKCASTIPFPYATTTTPNNVHKFNPIQIFPDIPFSLSAQIDIKTIQSTEIVIPPPKGQTPLFVESIVVTIKNFNVVLGSIINVTIPISESITLEANSAGSFNAQVSIPDAPFTDESSVDVDGLGTLTYGFSINPYILFCATPVPPVTFVNLCVDVEFSVSCQNPIIGQPISLVQGFSVLCPEPIEE